MNKNLYISLFFLITGSFVTIAQDCKCKNWRKISYDNSGNQKYEYEHKCSQPGSEWEYIGYDESFCNQLIEEEKKRIEDQKKTNEAIKISQNTEKQEYKDGYTVIAWKGKTLGTTGKIDLVGAPHFGIKQDSSFIQWNDNGVAEIRGRIKNKKLYGLLEFYENGNEYLDPTYLFKNIRDYLQIETIWYWKPDKIYDVDLEKFELEENSKKKGINQTFHGIYYSEISGQKKYFSHYFITDGFVTLFSKSIDEETAFKIHEKININESKIQVDKLKDYLSKLNDKFEILFPENILKNGELEEKELGALEQNLIGSWQFNSKKAIVANEEYELIENIIFNDDKSYLYKGRIQSSAVTLFQNEEKGLWKLENSKVILTKNIENTEFKSYLLFEQELKKRVKKNLDLLSKYSINELSTTNQWDLINNSIKIITDDSINYKYLYYSIYGGSEGYYNHKSKTNINECLEKNIFPKTIEEFKIIGLIQMLFSKEEFTDLVKTNCINHLFDKIRKDENYKYFENENENIFLVINELKAKKISLQSVKISDTLIYRRNIKKMKGKIDNSFTFDNITGKKT
jgi:hypothetical protein